MKELTLLLFIPSIFNFHSYCFSGKKRLILNTNARSKAFICRLLFTHLNVFPMIIFSVLLLILLLFRFSFVKNEA